MLTSRSKNYNEIVNKFNDMVKSNKTESEAAAYLVQMINKGWLSEADANRLARSAGMSL